MCFIDCFVFRKWWMPHKLILFMAENPLSQPTVDAGMVTINWLIKTSTGLDILSKNLLAFGLRLVPNFSTDTDVYKRQSVILLVKKTYFAEFVFTFFKYAWTINQIMFWQKIKSFSFPNLLYRQKSCSTLLSLKYIQKVGISCASS